MSGSLFAVNVFLHDTVLEDTNGCENIQCVLVTWIDTVEDQADDLRQACQRAIFSVFRMSSNYDLLPGRSTLVPKLGFLEVDDVTDVLHDTVERTRSQHFVFVVIGDGDQKLRVSVVHRWSQVVSVLESELIGITSCGRVCITN